MPDMGKFFYLEVSSSLFDGLHLELHAETHHREYPNFLPHGGCRLLPIPSQISLPPLLILFAESEGWILLCFYMSTMSMYSTGIQRIFQSSKLLCGQLDLTGP